MSKIIFILVILPFLANCSVVSRNEVPFVKLGKYRGFTSDGTEYQKTYYVSRYMMASWGEARAICKSYDMEPVSVETLEEAKAFLNLAEFNSFLKTINPGWIAMDGQTFTPKSRTDWYWTNSGKKIAFDIPWVVNMPDFLNNVEYCLSIRVAPYSVGFNDIPCFDKPLFFTCMRTDFWLPVELPPN